MCLSWRRFPVDGGEAGENGHLAHQERRNTSPDGPLGVETSAESSRRDKPPPRVLHGTHATARTKLTRLRLRQDPSTSSLDECTRESRSIRFILLVCSAGWLIDEANLITVLSRCSNEPDAQWDEESRTS